MSTTSKRWCCLLLISLCSLAASKPRGFTVIVEPENQIFPALELASAPLRPDQFPEQQSNILGEADGLIGVRLRATTDNESVQVTLESPELMRPSVLDVRLPKAGKSYELFPAVRWRYADLRRWHKSKTLPIQIKVQRGAKFESTAQSVRVHGLNQALVAYDRLDFAWLFAAFVDEDHPLSETILQRALDAQFVSRFSGYESGDPEEVRAQLFAIWSVLREQGLRYGNIPPLRKSGSKVLSQPVRFLEESWGSKEANCVDGSVLLASALERAGLRSALVLVPGHMLLGVALDPNGNEWTYVETTLIGTTPQNTDALDFLLANDPLNQRYLDDERAQRALPSFASAQAEGERRVQIAGARFEQEIEVEYRMIDIQAARAVGVQPLRRGTP